MNISWISITPKLKTGIDIINSIEKSQFAKLLEQIHRFHSEDPFSQSELQELQENLGLNLKQLELLLQTAFYIFKQSLKVILKPTGLQKQLVEALNFRDDKAEEFVKAWTIVTKRDFGNLEDRFNLTEISWELNLQTSSPLQSKELTPNLQLKLGLTKTHSVDEKNILLELDEKELLQLYNTFENIQNKIDFLQRND
ncbi:hypothetical protein PPYR_10408 [Photinus pyralis]|uniref:COMM domain-containing protein n=1 Tax=Photinus pyralis TaxID=7054 RepID=A0A5N4AG98_PHOPY|nr:COMM domain-containing protein 10 [Photinus pyralis]KAB0796347.1 hypothetical protein PPYR_10408 [Photinus pyralis]